MKGQRYQHSNNNGSRQSAPVNTVFKTPFVSTDEFISIDVECVASGPGHNDRVIASVAVVNVAGEVLLYKLIKPSVPVFNYLSIITGFNEDSLKDGEAEDKVLGEVYALLNPNVVIVGQSPQSDIAWLKLVQGVHYNRLVDLADLFQKVKPDGRVFKFSLEHEVRMLLMTEEQLALPQQHHTAINDAVNSMLLFNRYGECSGCSNRVLNDAVNKLNNNRPIPSVAKQVNYFYEGVCMAAFSPLICKCGQPSKNNNNLMSR